LSEAVEALAGVEEQLYVSLDGILGRNVKRVQDGLKRVKRQWRRRTGATLRIISPLGQEEEVV